MLENNSVYLSELNTNSSSQDEETEEVCIANISPLERQKRLRFGIIQFIFALLVLAVMIAPASESHSGDYHSCSCFGPPRLVTFKRAIKPEYL